MWIENVNLYELKLWAFDFEAVVKSYVYQQSKKMKRCNPSMWEAET